MADDDEVLGEVVLLEVVGRGTDSVVHRGRQRDRSGRIVAVKRLRTDADADVLPDALARLRREADLLAGLAHPAIVPLLDVVEDPAGGGVALVLPWAPGGSLEDVLARDGALPWPRVADVGARLASALASAHAAGVLHRDVKPANVLLGAEDEPRLADFGTADLRAAGSGHVVGTAEYLDPAVAVDGQPYSARSDAYALGVLLYRALAGQLPVAAGSPQATVAAAARGVHAPLADLAPDAPPSLVEAIERAMARAPDDRFASLQQLQVVLEALVTEHEADQWDRLGHQLSPSGAPPADRPDAPAPPTIPASERPAPELGSPESAPSPARPGGDSGTRLFGPRPPAPAAEADTGTGARRWAVPLVLVALLLPVAVVGWLLLRADGTPEPTASPSAAAPTPHAAPPRCDAAAVPPGDGAVVEADVDGRGCALPLLVGEEDVDGHPALVLTVPSEAGELAGRYAVGVPGDRLLAGDWDCDGTETPAVVRDDGTTYLFDGYGALDPVPGPTLPDGAAPAVVTDAGGCDLLVGRS